MLLISIVVLRFEWRIGIRACRAHPLLFLHHLLLTLVGKNVESSVTTRPRHVLSPESGSLGSFPGIGNPSPGLKVRVATPPPPLVIDRASSGSHRPSSLDHPIGTTIPLSPLLVHFFYYTASTPWVFNNWNIKCKASTWCLNSRYSLQLLSQTCSLFCYHKNPKIITT